MGCKCSKLHSITEYTRAPKGSSSPTWSVPLDCLIVPSVISPVDSVIWAGKNKSPKGLTFTKTLEMDIGGKISKDSTVVVQDEAILRSSKVGGRLIVCNNGITICDSTLEEGSKVSAKKIILGRGNIVLNGDISGEIVSIKPQNLFDSEQEFKHYVETNEGPVRTISIGPNARFDETAGTSLLKNIDFNELTQRAKKMLTSGEIQKLPKYNQILHNLLTRFRK